MTANTSGSSTQRAQSANESRLGEIARTPALSQQIVARALHGSSSPRQAIKARCLQCSNFQREEIAHCSVVTCALWQYRPYQEGE